MSDLAMDLAPAPAGLLAPDEAAPYALFNAEGAASVILLCDHASAFIPRALKALGLDEAQRARHIAVDIGVAELTRNLARRLDAPAVLSHFSRLIVDPNRGADDPTLIPEISDGVVVAGNRDLDAGARQARIEAFYRPYHAALARTIAAKLAELGNPEVRPGGPAPALVSMHSFTPVIKGMERRLQIGVLWNRDPRLPLPLIASLRAKGVVVGDNEPYTGRGGHGHSLHFHAEPQGLPHALLEVRQDLIDTHQGAAEWTEVVGDALAACLADPALFVAEPM